MLKNERCQSPCASCQAHKSNPFSVLTAVELDELAEARQVKSFRKGEYLFKSGQPVKGIYCLFSGAVKITQVQGSKAIAVRLASSGEWVGHRSIFTSEVYRGSAVAKENVRACLVPTDILHQFFASNKNFAHHLIRQIAHDLEKTERRLLDYQKLNVPSRLISLFRKLDKKFGESYKNERHLSIRLTKVEIAELVGASQEVVIRQISKWKKESLLREEGRKLFFSQDLLNRIIR